ncbi:hypothetical protein DL766_003315 [Monosporascus sp. MC13-8B]|uniref:Heterokaryon incompatibility domain-containing protein n=1 Tax=Monosporascus cannonballus TaxID=155416 RepID=A0ABY0H831_9PEZI|nr:hypothetical protein DL763_010839 [Monosporascus cannonballus]RYO87277.1 hypothetical protein DL762_004322 [Monosporascus cannonballus]RYP33726.1 hypothetical protein DL766_003315 [Monosporascus sp. MC13-8B]
MYLIDTDTFKLKYFSTHTAQKDAYAILSHTWEDEEVTFELFKDEESAKKRKGWAKIASTVQMARRSGLKYAWVDTCCIDKSSSAELSEAINSMFQYYEDARVCYVYLSDLPSVRTMKGPETVKARSASFARCRWFMRGWTLQELVAPRVVEFYDAGWNYYGANESLVDAISSITNIPSNVLKKKTPLQSVSVACRMSWAANRTTTKTEDRAYSLLGIFNINMALLYGEGDKAFIRLQEEICRQTADLSLFAWKAERLRGGGLIIPGEKAPTSPYLGQALHGILASSPSQFAHAGSYVQHSIRSVRYSGEYTLTNRGLRFDAVTLKCDREAGRYLLCLDCRHSGPELASLLAIRLMKVDNVYVRSHADDLFDWDIGAEGVYEERVYIAKILSPELSEAYSRDILNVHLPDEGKETQGSFYEIRAVSPRSCWDPLRRSFFVGQYDFICALRVEVDLRKFTSSPQPINQDVFLICCVIARPEFRSGDHQEWMTYICSLTGHREKNSAGAAARDRFEENFKNIIENDELATVEGLNGLLNPNTRFEDECGRVESERTLSLNVWFAA